MKKIIFFTVITVIGYSAVIYPISSPQQVLGNTGPVVHKLTPCQQAQLNKAWAVPALWNTLVNRSYKKVVVNDFFKLSDHEQQQLFMLICKLVNVSSLAQMNDYDPNVYDMQQSCKIYMEAQSTLSGKECKASEASEAVLF